MKQWKVRTHILLLTGTLLLALISTAGTALFSQQASVERLKSVYLDRVEPLHELKTIGDLYDYSFIDVPLKVRTGELDGKAANVEIEKSQEEIHTLWQAYLNTHQVEAELVLIDQLKPLIAQIEQPLDQLHSLLEQPDHDALERYISQQLYPKIAPIRQKLDALTAIQLVESKRQYEQGSADHARTLTVNVLVVLLALAASLTQAFYLTRRLNYQLGAEPCELEALSAKIAQGTLRIEDNQRLPMSGVMGSVDAMRNGLRQIIGDISQASEQIEQTSLQLVSSSEQALVNSQHQRDTASAMAATTEQLSASITHIAQNAQDTHEMTEEAAALTDSGLQVIDQASTEMQTIADLVQNCTHDVETLAEQSRNISTIVDVIREIAEQTNLLALNAAIEAARAGDQGRGFAVVADEVRSLAGRTARSTTEIVALVEAIQTGMSKAKTSMAAGCERVVIGTQLMDQAGSAMTAIRTALSQSLEAVGVINHSLQEQRLASEQVAMSVEQVAYSAEENSAAQGGIAEAIQSMQSMSEGLQGVIRRFSL